MSDNEDSPSTSKKATRPKPPKRSPRGPPPPVQPRPRAENPGDSSPTPQFVTQTAETQSDLQPKRSSRRKKRVVLPDKEMDSYGPPPVESYAPTLPPPSDRPEVIHTRTEQPETYEPHPARSGRRSSSAFGHIFKRREASRPSEADPDPEATQHRRSTIGAREIIKAKASRILYTTDEEVRDALMEFGVFIIFLILTSLVTLSVRHSYMFYLNDTIKKLFTTRDMVISPSVTVNFEKLITIPDFWDYLIYNFLVILHGDMTVVNPDGSHAENEDDDEQGPPSNEPAENEPDSEAPGGESEDKPPDGDDGGGARVKRLRSGYQTHFKKRQGNLTRLEGRVFLHENLLLGPPRLRQIRVRKDSCYVSDAFIRYFNTCYAEFSPSAEEIVKEHGGAPYKTMGELDSMPLWTTLGFYRSGGYTVDLTYSKKKNLNTIKELMKNHWLDRGSRLCLIEFNLYNENTDIFQSAKFIAEIPPTGGVIPQSQLQTVKQFSFITDKSLTMSVVYIFWYIMVVYYNIYEINAMRKCGLKNYFKSILNIQDLLIQLFCYLALVYNIWHTFKIKSLVSRVRFEESYQSLDTLCFWNTIYVDMMAILAFLVWIKIFKFISFNKTLVQFTTTLKRCSKDLAGFSLMFGIVFLAYAQLGLLLFGTKHPDFRNFVTSILTMIRMILGDFQYNLIEDANRVLGPIYFLTYILLVFFILLNMFLAIIMETYNTVKSEITQGRSQLGSYIYKKVTGFLYIVLHCGRKRQQQAPRPQRHDADDDLPDDLASSRYQQPKVQLRRHMTEAEAQYFEDVPNDVKDKDMFRLNNRVSLLEEILEQLVTNMDAILKRVENEIKKNK
ncbi:polycystic kidney disease 2-like 2 protein [Drosophila novamexicana]|uniref:polycystic kidney disease 2-like 2 protein n=1 Tax=Drosophila novamexicana TaxID=47314 RepID=UPI0011E5A73F|nr:polycystic kidney disease 2-like 2 protein [Drosophila novamexicana]